MDSTVISNLFLFLSCVEIEKFHSKMHEVREFTSVSCPPT